MSVSAVICAGACVLVRLYVLVGVLVRLYVLVSECVLVRLYVLVRVC